MVSAAWQGSTLPDGVTFIEGMRLLAGADPTGDVEEDLATKDWSQVAAGDWLRDTFDPKLRV